MNFVDIEYDYKDLMVIVVEDNAVIREIVLQVLRDLEITNVHYTKTAKQGLRVFLDQPSDLVIAEVSEESGNGLEMLETLRHAKDKHVASTPFIMLAAYPERETVMRVHDAGAEALVAEPFSPKTLAEHIHVVMQQRFKAANPAEPCRP